MRGERLLERKSVGKGLFAKLLLTLSERQNRVPPEQRPIRIANRRQQHAQMIEFPTHAGWPRYKFVRSIGMHARHLVLEEAQSLVRCNTLQMPTHRAKPLH